MKGAYMSDILINPMYGDTGLATVAHPRVFTGSFTTEEMSLCYVIVTISAVSGGVNAGNPASIIWETSLNKGVTWRTVDGVTADPITGAGEFIAKLTADTTVVGPTCRVRIVPPAGETVTVDKCEKSKITDLAVFRGGAGGGGGGGATGTIVGVGGAAPYTSGAALSGQTVAAYIIGYDGVSHREIQLTAAGGILVEQETKSVIEAIRIDYSVTNVTTLAWVTLVAATAAQIEWMDMFDSSGETMEIGTGAAGAEVQVGYVIPGGNRINQVIPAGTRISIRAVSADATIGEHTSNMFG
jgi:hypothetical protein